MREKKKKNNRIMIKPGKIGSHRRFCQLCCCCSQFSRSAAQLSRRRTAFPMTCQVCQSWPYSLRATVPREGCGLPRERSGRRLGALRIRVPRWPPCAHLSALAPERAERGDACGFHWGRACALESALYRGGREGGKEEGREKIEKKTGGGCCR